MEFIPKKNFIEDYIQAIGTDGVWGSHHELQAICNALNLTIQKGFISSYHQQQQKSNRSSFQSHIFKTIIISAFIKSIKRNPTT